jgi:hypothetical protein
MAPKKAAASASKSQKGLWTKSALEVKSEAKLTHSALIAAAVEYCKEHKCGGKKAANAPEFSGKLTKNQIDYARAYPDTERNKYDVLTATELAALKGWIRASEAKNCPVPAQEVLSKKIREFLLARALFNRKNHKSKNLDYLTKHEWDIVKNKVTAGGHTWVQRNLLSDSTLQLKNAKAQDAKRAGKQREEVVTKHYDGPSGLVAELKRLGIMDDDGIILDGRRIINMDEMPEFLDYLKGKAGKAWGTKGKPLEITDSENKETATVMMAADQKGFIYGVQFLFKRKTLTEGMTACMNVPPAAKCFDSQIYHLEQRSTYCLVSPTDKGMQTGKTFLEFLHMLREQVDHRNRILVAHTPESMRESHCRSPPLRPPTHLPTAAVLYTLHSCVSPPTGC